MEEKFKEMLDALEQMQESFKECYDRMCYSQMCMNQLLSKIEELKRREKNAEADARGIKGNHQESP